ncbi:hypothetical protein SAMD00019534_002330, partial [Acytostelium subglobosum LB1]|uniref:hypothetical protein n=1 Tax=Acytostelium subglobosum LB1 TaxID=1410327 RepID=UPI000644B837
FIYILFPPSQEDSSPDCSGSTLSYIYHPSIHHFIHPSTNLFPYIYPSIHPITSTSPSPHIPITSRDHAFVKTLQLSQISNIQSINPSIKIYLFIPPGGPVQSGLCPH